MLRELLLLSGRGGGR